MNLDSISIQLPSDEEMSISAKKWWNDLEPHCFHKWSEELIAVTYPLRMVKIPKDLIMPFLNIADGADKEAFFGPMRELIAPVLKEMGCEDRFFAKLCSRSPKDFLSTDGIVRPLCGVEDLLNALSCSMRCFDDMCMMMPLDVAYIVLRPFIDFEPWREWRVLVQEGKIAGISQYHYQTQFNFDDDEIVDIDWLIRDFIDRIVIPNFGLPDFVADIILDETPILLELNPFGLSDPCLFESYDKLDGSIRVLR